jgi:hypothetical protein
MLEPREELRRVRLRIAELERCVEETREDDGLTLGAPDRRLMLQLLTMTLQAMRARRRALESDRDAGRGSAGRAVHNLVHSIVPGRSVA